MDGDLHLWIGDLHLWIGDLHLWIGDLHFWKVIYICEYIWYDIDPIYVPSTSKTKVAPLRDMMLK